MPELPEVETVCRGLNDSILGKTFTLVENHRPNLRIPFPDDFSEKLEGRKIISVSRRAKYILITLDNKLVIIAHLGMSGKIIVYPNYRGQLQKHDHATFLMDDGKEMVFNDPRRFGLITFSHADDINDHKLIYNLGVEPLSDEFDENMLNSILSKVQER